MCVCVYGIYICRLCLHVHATCMYLSESIISIILTFFHRARVYLHMEQECSVSPEGQLVSRTEHD